MSQSDVQLAVRAGADALGFVTEYPVPVPWNIPRHKAAELAAAAPPFVTTTAVVGGPVERILEIAQVVHPHVLQLHGEETPERVAEIAQRFARPVMKALKVNSTGDAQNAFAYAGKADLILFDAKAPQNWPGTLPGGNGIAFDWRVLEGVRGKIDYMLAGGLTHLNVAKAIRMTGAKAVDVSSGVEARPGEKDPELIRRFLQAAKAANQDL